MPLSQETEAKLAEAKDAGAILEEALRAEVERLTAERDAAMAAQATVRETAFTEAVAAITSLKEGS